jgi:hypothetical protein
MKLPQKKIALTDRNCTDKKEAKLAELLRCAHTAQLVFFCFMQQWNNVGS